jgi:probable F420-dependent oxidoreductase
MRLGVSIAQVGRLADPAVIRSAASGAEQVGYSSIWVLDQLTDRAAIRRTSPPIDGGPPEGALPGGVGATLDPLGVLTYAAAVTNRVRLGTSVLVTPWYRPTLLARSVATLDVLSDGRLTVGLGLGWALDDYAAVGVPQRELGARLEDALDVLDSAWISGGSSAGPAPVQWPRPPVLLAASTPRGLERIARRADGWNPAGLPVDLMRSGWTIVRDAAAEHGRDPDALELVPRATVTLTARPVDGDRPECTGTVEQVIHDIDAIRRAGAHEVIVGLSGDPSFDQAMETYAAIAEALDLSSGRPAPAVTASRLAVRI